MRNADACALCAEMMLRVPIAALLLIGSSLAWTQSAFALQNNTNLTGSWSCECTSGGETAAGTCTLTTTTHGSICEKGTGDTCTGKCTYSTTISGVTGGEAAKPIPGGAKVKPVAPGSVGTKKMP